MPPRPARPPAPHAPPAARPFLRGRAPGGSCHPHSGDLRSRSHSFCAALLPLRARLQGATKFAPCPGRRMPAVRALPPRLGPLPSVLPSAPSACAVPPRTHARRRRTTSPWLCKRGSMHPFCGQVTANPALGGRPGARAQGRRAPRAGVRAPASRGAHSFHGPRLEPSHPPPGTCCPPRCSRAPALAWLSGGAPRPRCGCSPGLRSTGRELGVCRRKRGKQGTEASDESKICLLLRPARRPLHAHWPPGRRRACRSLPWPAARCRSRSGAAARRRGAAMRAAPPPPPPAACPAERPPPPPGRARRGARACRRRPPAVVPRQPRAVAPGRQARARPSARPAGGLGRARPAPPLRALPRPTSLLAPRPRPPPSLAGDYGFDPLGLGEEPSTLRWMVQAELQNGRWAMLGVAGILFTAVRRRARAC